MKKILILLLMFSLSAVGVFAGDKQLELVSSSIEDGAEAVGLSPVFELEFSNNVINMKVQEANKAAIVLLNAAGEEMPIAVEMADDQVSPDLKRMVTVKTSEALSEGAAYELVIKSGFSAKNGTVIKEDTIIHFKTEGGASFPWMSLLVFAAVMGIGGFVFAQKRQKNAKA